MEREFTVIIERDDEGFYLSRVPELKDCAANARTLDELIARTREMILLSLVERKGYRQRARFIGIQRVAVKEDSA